eukprot:2010975-Heterocapsa_arctica.AAC.1
MSGYLSCTDSQEHFAPHLNSAEQDSNEERASAGYAGGAHSSIQQGRSGEYLMPNVLEGDVANDGVGNQHNGCSPVSMWELIRSSSATSLTKTNIRDLVEGTLHVTHGSKLVSQESQGRSSSSFL